MVSEDFEGDSFLPEICANAVHDLEKRAYIYKDEDEMKLTASIMRSAAHVALPVDGFIYRPQTAGGLALSSFERESFENLPAPITTFEMVLTKEHAEENKLLVAIRYHDVREEGGLIPPWPISKCVLIVYDRKQLDEDQNNFLFGEGDSEVISGPGSENAKLVELVVYDAYRKYFFLYKWAVMMWFDDVGLCMQPLSTLKTSDEEAIKNGTYKNQIDTEEKAQDVAYIPFCLLDSVVQFCHAIRSGATTRVKSQTGSRARKLAKRGVGGFEYHILRLPRGIDSPAITKNSRGSHATPRFHMRRAHLRMLSSGKSTFVRRSFVGKRKEGVIVKTYAVKDTAEGKVD